MANKNDKIREFYQDNGWRKTISEFKISPTNLSKIVKKGKGNEEASSEDPPAAAKPKTKKKGKKKTAKAKAKSVAPANDVSEIIAQLSEGLEKLKTALAA